MKNKLLIVATEKRFELNEQGQIVNRDNTRAVGFWERYLTVFDKVIVIARISKKNRVISYNFVEKDGIIKVFPLSNYQGLSEGLIKQYLIRRELNYLIRTNVNASYLLRVPGSVSNLLAAKLIKMNLNYSVEVVGDPYEVFATQKGIVPKILALIERNNLKRNLLHAFSAAYVTEKSLQKNYPFNGYQTYFSSINLSDSFFVDCKSFNDTFKLSLIGVGNLEMPYKGVDILLNALKILEDKNIPFKLTWLGVGELIHKYKEKCQELGIDDKIHFMGVVPNIDIPKYLQINNIFILPSRTEGLPRAMVEAMASGLICLGSNVGGIPELLDEYCLFPPNNSVLLAEKLEFVYNNFNSYKRYSGINIMKAKEYLPSVLRHRRDEFFKTIPKN